MKYHEPESSTLEFKAELPKNNQIIKTIIGFANQHGGRLILGINDTGKVVGVNQDMVEAAREYLEKSIYEAATPVIQPSVYTQLLGDKMILIIEVSAGMQKPYYVRSEGLDKGVYIRVGRSTVRATPDMIEELRWQSRGRDFDKMAVYNAHEDDLDRPAIARFLTERKNRSQITVEQALVSYNLVTTEHSHTYPTNGGLLLFGKNPQQFFEHAIIMCGHFRGNSGREAFANLDCTGRLVDQYYAAYNFLLSRLHKSFTIRSSVREEKLEIPEVAIREVLINALVHRNYNMRSPIKIAIYENRVEIYSPGTFPGPVSQHGLLSGTTFWRNTVICKVFRELGLIELMGSGFLELFRSYKEWGLDTPQVIEGEGFIKCILPRPTVNKLQRKKSGQKEIGQQHQEILDLFKSVTALSVSNIIDALKIPRATASRRLSDMVTIGLLKKKGTGKGTRYYAIC